MIENKIFAEGRACHYQLFSISDLIHIFVLIKILMKKLLLSKHFMNKAHSILLVFIFCAFYSSGQIAELQIDKKHSVEIRPCVADGSLEIPKGYYETADTIYFIVKPKGDWEFSKGDLKILPSIQIKQSDHSIPSIGYWEFNDASNKTEKILISFERKRILFTSQFNFELDEFTSDIFEFPEQFWPYYYEFELYFNFGKQLNEKQQYIPAFQQLKNILPGSEHSLEYAHFSNYSRACDMIIPDVVSAYLKQQTEILQKLWSDFEKKKELTSQQLENIKTNRDSLIITDSIFEPYYSLTETKSIEFKKQHNKLINDYNDLYHSAYTVWKEAVLNTIANGNYENENKYQVYIELLARLLVYTNSVEKLSPYDSLDISLITNPAKKVPFLKRRIDILEKMKWKKDFITILQLINEEIVFNSTLIGQTHLLNLRGNSKLESQPNYYIINGFNELVKGNFEPFQENINLAIAKCTDLEMMYYLELWSFSYRFKAHDTKEDLIENINKGLEYKQKGMPKEALEQYEIAQRMGNCALPSFLIAMINLDIRQEIFSAEIFLSEAINIYPVFALANIYYLKILIDSKQFEQAQTKIEQVLEKPELSLWYIYYLQSKVLYLEYDYQGSLQVLQTKCRPLNPYNFEQYIMLGDIYLFQKNCAAAKENFQNAGNLQPNNKTYSIKMQMLISQCNQ